MRVLGVGDDHALAALYRRLIEEGHALRVSVAHAASQDVMTGLVERCGPDWRAQLPWVRAAGREGLIVFETAHHGAEQDALRAEGFHVVGGSAFGDRLEEDRDRGQRLLQDLGLPVARTLAFDDLHRAIAFLRERPGRYVYKVSSGESPSTSNYVGQLDDASDLIAVLQIEAGRGRPPFPFVLMEHVQGVETGVGAYFDGRRFLQPACIDWEHKRFFPGDLGELTGEMGTVVSFRGAEVMFERVLAPLEGVLREGRYRGWINVNTIVNADGIWPLEFTCRFGYPGFAICGALQRVSWGELLRRIAQGDGNGTFDTLPGYAVGVVLTVPPFPWDEPVCAPHPVFFRGGEPDADTRAHLHWAEVACAEDGSDRMRLAGNRGYPLVVTGVDEDLREAQRKANALAARVVVPNVRYRTDIGESLIRDGLARLASWGIRRVGGGSERPPQSTSR